MAYVGLESAESVTATPGPLIVVPTEGETARALFTPSADVPPADDCLWSPDGLSIYYKAHDAQGRASFWSVSSAGGAPRLLVSFDDPERQSRRKDFGTRSELEAQAAAASAAVGPAGVGETSCGSRRAPTRKT